MAAAGEEGNQKKDWKTACLLYFPMSTHILFMNYHNSTLHKINFQTSHTLQTVRDPFISATRLWGKTDFNTQIQQQQKEQSLLSWERTQTGRKWNSKHWDLSTVKQFKDDPWWLICSLQLFQNWKIHWGLLRWNLSKEIAVSLCKSSFSPAFLSPPAPWLQHAMLVRMSFSEAWDRLLSN